MHTLLLFPGQGSQCAGMGRDIAEYSDDAMDLWKKAEKASNLALREIFWEGDEAAMADTRALQPALTVVNLNLWREIHSKISPKGCAGHSLGEFSAMASAGAISFEDAVALTALRGRLMADADPEGIGAMSAIVKLSLDTVEEIVRVSQDATNKTLCIANYNTPAQYVISGSKTAVEHAASLVKEKKGRAISLKVSGAFHSPLMNDASKEFAPELEKVDWKTPSFPIYCNVTGKPTENPKDLKAALASQMTSSVQWISIVINQYQNGADSWLELGPKALLGKMVQSCLADHSEARDLHISAVCNLNELKIFSGF